jgi:hypothetical protein
MGRERSIHQASKMNTQIALRKAGVGHHLTVTGLRRNDRFAAGWGLSSPLPANISFYGLSHSSMASLLCQGTV